jgi:hypothetical protein
LQKVINELFLKNHKVFLQIVSLIIILMLFTASIIQLKSFAMYALIGVTATGVFIFATDKHAHRSEVNYPYLQIRTKAFPWGDGNTSLFDPVQKHGGHH